MATDLNGADDAGKAANSANGVVKELPPVSVNLEPATGQESRPEAPGDEPSGASEAVVPYDSGAGAAMPGDDDDAEGTERRGVTHRPARRRVPWARAVAFGVLPAVAMLIAAAAGYLKWQDSSIKASEVAATQSSEAAREATIKLLSYHPDTVDKDLGSARDLLTGDFQQAYTSLINDVVIPGARQKKISAVATVPAVASVSASDNHAVALLFVDQTVTMGADAPTDTASSVKVTLDKVGDRWLIAQFEPI